MKVAVFATTGYDKASFTKVNQQFEHDLSFYEPRLTPETAVLAAGYEAVCVFVNDQVNRETIAKLAAGGTRIIATRSAGYTQIDLRAAEVIGITVVRVPAYSPNAISEFTVALILTLGRQIHRAYNRVRDNNFELDLVYNGEEALDKAYETRYDLYIFDVNVPAIKGFDLLKYLG